MFCAFPTHFYVHIEYGITWYFMGINGKMQKIIIFLTFL